MWYYTLGEPHFLGGRLAGVVRQGDWNLIEFFDTGEYELYNLRNDPGENRNLIEVHPEKARELQSGLKEWRDDVLSETPYKKHD